MQKVTAFARKTDGTLMTAGTGTFAVYLPGTTTPVTVYSTDSTGGGSPSLTIPVTGKIEFYARNADLKIVATEGASTVTIDDFTVTAGTTFGTFASRPAAGSADRLYFATDTGRLYYDNESAWKEVPDYALDAMDWAAAVDVVAAATTDVFGGTGNYVEVTHASGTLAITALASSNATEGSPRLVRFTISGGTLSLTHNATSLEIVGSANLTLATGDWALVVGKGSSNVKVIPFLASGYPVVERAGTMIGFAYTESNTSDTSTTVIPQDDTIPQNTEGEEYTQIATTYTPRFSTSKLRVRVFLPFWYTSASRAQFALFRDAAADAIQTVAAQQVVTGNVANGPVEVTAIVDAVAAVATTFKLRYGGESAGTIGILRNSAGDLYGTAAKAYMTVEEIRQ